MDTLFERSSKVVHSEAKKFTMFMSQVKERNPFLKVKLAPLRVPTNRRLQTAAALYWITLPFIANSLTVTLIYLAAYYVYLRYVLLLYFFYMYLDQDSCEQGGRRLNWYRSLKLWEYYRDYFPVHLVKTADLPADQNYLFAVYPHGILSSGAFTAFATDALDFTKLFNGLVPYCATLKINFNFPFIREIALSQGLVAASKRSLNWILSSPGTGRVACLVVGGAAEALYNKPGEYKIVLKHRKGFCKIALQNGSPLVPVFTFGEIDIYSQYEPEHGSILDSFQYYFKKITGIAPVMFFGRGVFNYTFGFLPRRKPLTVVVGKPIVVEKVKDPTDEQINALHKQFQTAILKLFDDEKVKYLEDPTQELIID